MEVMHVLVLSLLQGITEFLPISSSAHLILVPRLADWPDQGIAFDIAVHVGTLSAVVLYFHRELVPMVRAWFGWWGNRRLTPDARLAWAVLLGTIPVGLAGLAFSHAIETTLRSPLVIAATTILFGALLWWADARRGGERDEHTIGWRDVLIIGIAQAIALIPGTSRSGITMTAGLMVGLGRQAAARFSFLLSIPVIALAGLLESVKLLQQPQAIDWTVLILGAVLSGLSAFLVIHYFLRLIARVSMLPFAIYRLLLGLVLIALFY
jgi:undecaprenyl-diphosphatase